MSSVPQGAFAAFKVKQNLENSIKLEQKQKITPFTADKLVFDQPPLNYSSKLMKSIWGLYNRYSVHNLKKNTDSGDFNVFDNQRM